MEDGFYEGRVRGDFLTTVCVIKSRISHASEKSRADILIHKAKLPAVRSAFAARNRQYLRGETHAKIGNNPGSGKASGPTTIDLHEIFR